MIIIHDICIYIYIYILLLLSLLHILFRAYSLNRDFRRLQWSKQGTYVLKVSLNSCLNTCVITTVQGVQHCSNTC